MRLVVPSTGHSRPHTHTSSLCRRSRPDAQSPRFWGAARHSRYVRPLSEALIAHRHTHTNPAKLGGCSPTLWATSSQVGLDTHTHTHRPDSEHLGPAWLGFRRTWPGLKLGTTSIGFGGRRHRTSGGRALVRLFARAFALVRKALAFSRWMSLSDARLADGHWYRCCCGLLLSPHSGTSHAVARTL